jgi:hypothetical protein
MMAVSILACPDCATARAARDLVFSDGFWVNSWYAVLPFVVAVLVVRWIVRRVDQRVDQGVTDGQPHVDRE